MRPPAFRRRKSPIPHIVLTGRREYLSFVKKYTVVYLHCCTACMRLRRFSTQSLPRGNTSKPPGARAARGGGGGATGPAGAGGQAGGVPPGRAKRKMAKKQRIGLKRLWRRAEPIKTLIISIGLADSYRPGARRRKSQSQCR
jgi:hypothetical protein